MEKTITVKRDEHKELTITEPGKYVVELVESGAEVVVRGAFKGTKADKIDISVVIHHKAPNTQANTMLRGVAQDTARINFSGRIIIDHNCGNSNSFLTERVLLLSDQAVAECVPDLEIYTDDVKCSHAASVTKIPDEHVFYLMSRGISRKQAEEMIVEGFLSLDN